MTSHPTPSSQDISPSARRLSDSLRDIGYDFPTALADIVDNSIAAAATRVDIKIAFSGPRSYVTVADDGIGMSAGELVEALRFGSRRAYQHNELGRYGLGLKTASISQAKRLTLISRRSHTQRRISAQTLDLNHVAACDRWELIPPPEDSIAKDCEALLADGPGTVVLWEVLDRVLPLRRPEGGWARRRMDLLAARTSDYLGMVFHRFIEGGQARPKPLVITVNGNRIRPWNPFAAGEPNRTELSPERFEISEDGQQGVVRLHRYILPSKEEFSTIGAFERMSGPRKWNRQQGLYIYRANRLIQGGGWSGLRAPDEHTKYARAALDFDTDLDLLFRINVAKMRVTLPAELKPQLERPVHDLCARADAAYRRDAGRRALPTTKQASAAGGDTRGVGAALLSAALDAGEFEALDKIMEAVRSRFPEMALALGW